jgi:hypothetical protein
LSAIRPLRPEDLGAVAALYSELTGRDPQAPAPGFAAFYERVLLQAPLADPEVPTLVYEDPEDGVVGLIGSHARRARFGDRDVLAACSGPLIVARSHRPRGIGALLLRRYLKGPQELTFNDRLTDEVHSIWRRLGGVTDPTTSIGWRRVLAPLGARAAARSLHTASRHQPRGAAAYAALDSLAGRGSRPPAPAEGASEDLSPQALVDLYEGLRREFSLRPAFDAATVAALFAATEGVDLGGELVARLVRGGDGEPVGAFTMIAGRHGTAHVLEVATAAERAGLVLDHLFQVAAELGAVAASGRVEAHLLDALGSRDCRFFRDAWTMTQTRDLELRDAVLSGRALLTRLEGEWWMRPQPGAA